MPVGLACRIVTPGEDTAPPGCKRKAEGARKEVVELTRELVQGRCHLRKRDSVRSLPGLYYARYTL